jgi:hypothetical protein
LSPLVAALLACLPAWALDVRLSHVEATDVAGVLQAVADDGSWVIFTPEGGEPTTLAIDEVVRISFGARERTSSRDAIAVLSGGDVLSGGIIGGGQERIRLRNRAVGEIAVSLERLRGVILPSAPAEMRSRLLRSLTARSVPRDRVIFPNGDVVEGVILKVSDKNVTIESGLGARPLPYTELAAFVVAELQPLAVRPVRPGKREVVAVLHTADGSRLSGRLTGLTQEAVRYRTRLGHEVEVQASAIIEITFRGGRVTYLSELRPQRVRQTPLIRGEPTPWTLQRDRSVLGTPLRLDKKIYERGLGMHSRCEATYRLDGKYSRLLGTIGIDEGATGTSHKPAAPGGVVFRVHLDGKMVFDSGPVSRGDAPRPLRVAVAAARTLTLEVDFGPDGDDRGDHADWADIRLVK